jgi:hypothetical protein
VVVKLLDDHVAHRGLPRRRPSRNPLEKIEQQLTIRITRMRSCWPEGYSRAGWGGGRMDDIPMTKGCRTAGGEVSSGATAAGEAVPFA